MTATLAIGRVAAWEQSDPAAYDGFTHGLESAAGKLSGTGISYRTWILPKVGVQACALGTKLPAGWG